MFSSVAMIAINFPDEKVGATRVEGPDKFVRSRNLLLYSFSP